MSQVVGLDGRQVPHETLAERATNALIALRQLVAAVEAGEIELDSWMLLYDTQSRENQGNLLAKSLDSGLTVAEATYMAHNFIFDTALRVRGFYK